MLLSNNKYPSIQFDVVKLKRLKQDTSSGLDKIHPMVLQNTEEVVTNPLTRIF